MRATARLALLLGVALSALVFGPWPAAADWTRVKLADGTQVCRDKDTGAQFKPPYSGASQVTVGCNTLTSFIPWLGTAEGQQVAIFRGSIPTDLGTTPTPTLPPAWTQTDIGSPPVAGSAFVTQGVMTIIGSGDVHATADTAHFVYQAVTGDQRIQTTVQTVLGGHTYDKCGLMARDSTAADSKLVLISANPNNTGSAPNFTSRINDGDYAGATYNGTAQSLPLSYRLDIVGSTITAYTSTDSFSTSEARGSATLTMSGTVDLGAFTSSGGEPTSATCTLTEPVITALGASPAGVVDFTAGAQSMREDAADPSICLARSGGNSGAASATVTNIGTGTAVSGTDFTDPPFPKSLSWMDGESGNKCFTLVVADRSGAQATRTLNMGIASPSGVTVGTTIVNQTLTITDKDAGAVKFQPGWYGGFNHACRYPDDNCTSSAIISTINSEICSNANLVGLKLSVYLAYLIPDSAGPAGAGSYTGNTQQGFTAIDAILGALQACGKFLMLEGEPGAYGGYGAPNTVVPSFTYPASGCGLYTCAGGTAVGDAYGVVINTQASQPGFNARGWRNDWRDLAIAATQAYCARYDSNPAFYSINMLYYNTSLPFAYPYTNGYDETTYHAKMYDYHAAARAACPTTNVPNIEDYVDGCSESSCTRMVADIQDLKTNHGVITQNDIWPGGPSDGARVYTGMTGGTDYRGVVRFWEAFEGPCYGVGTPAQIFDIVRNGNANQRPRWANTIVIWMDNGCAGSGQEWNAWKTFIASISGQVMDARGPTLRTPAYVKANSCETQQVCQ